MNIEKLQMVPVKMSVPLYTGAPKTQPEKSFGEFLSNSLQKVNALQKDAHDMNIALAAGKVDDISQVVIASEKAQLALNLTMSIRNKAVEAYQEIMRMQV